jgi:putative ABC transport system permease protein
MINDFRYAVRGLVKKPLFPVLTVLTLALGIGANAAIFSVINGVLLRPLPYPHPERLMMVWIYNPRQGFDKDVAPYPTFTDWRNQSRSFEHLAAYSGASVTLTAGSPSRTPPPDTSASPSSSTACGNGDSAAIRRLSAGPSS